MHSVVRPVAAVGGASRQRHQTPPRLPRSIATQTIMPHALQQAPSRFGNTNSGPLCMRVWLTAHTTIPASVPTAALPPGHCVHGPEAGGLTCTTVGGGVGPPTTTSWCYLLSLGRQVSSKYYRTPCLQRAVAEKGIKCLQMRGTKSSSARR
jgi:hypothetical protein